MEENLAQKIIDVIKKEDTTFWRAEEALLAVLEMLKERKDKKKIN
ncbi:hypothetical protein [Listeria grandensis]|nr:hypothetical protein [Listeria grandensis]